MRLLWVPAQLLVLGLGALTAQQPTPPPNSLPVLGPYRAPALALVQPTAGGSVPQDRPVVVFRFAPGEPNDPVDARSFAVTVDGENRSSLFQISPSEAWGPLAPSRADGAPAISIGAHHIAARICSTRGACTEVITTVTVAPPATSATSIDSAADRKRSLVDLILTAARKLLNP